jgi:hypothetical protein
MSSGNWPTQRSGKCCAPVLKQKIPACGFIGCGLIPNQMKIRDVKEAAPAYIFLFGVIVWGAVQHAWGAVFVFGLIAAMVMWLCRD